MGRDCGCDDDFFTRSRRRRAHSEAGGNPREAHDKAVIMRQYRLPDYRKTRPEASLVSDQVSRSCGDQVRVFLDLDAEGRISQASYQGEGCSVSIASCSIMCAALLGKDLFEAACLSRDVLGMLEAKDAAEARVYYDFLCDKAGGIDPEGHATSPAWDDVLALWSIRSIPARVPCALLAWKIIPALPGAEQA